MFAVISFTELQNIQVGRLVGIGEGEGDLAVPIPVEKRWTDKDEQTHNGFFLGNALSLFRTALKAQAWTVLLSSILLGFS